MCHKQIIVLLLGMVAGSPLLAQDEGGASQVYCTIEPVFHCAESINDGSVIGHFGYTALCPETGKPIESVFIDIGDENYFTPGPIDRGQPKVFLSGEHVDEFERDFTAKEVKEGKEFSWTIRKIRIPIDFSKTKDRSLDCTNLPY